MNLFRIVALYLALLSGDATCSIAQYEVLAPEAQENIEATVGDWDFPREAIIVDDRDGTVWLVRRNWLPSACRPQEEDQVTVVSPRDDAPEMMVRAHRGRGRVHHRGHA